MFSVKQPCRVVKWFADLLTAAQVFLRRYTALDCSADRIALKEEKFFNSLHSYTDTSKGFVMLFKKNVHSFVSVTWNDFPPWPVPQWSTSQWCVLCGQGWRACSEVSSGPWRGTGREWRRWAMRWERKWGGWVRTDRGVRWWHGWWWRWTGRWWRGRWAPSFYFLSCHAETRRSPGSGRAPLWQTDPVGETMTRTHRAS